MAEHSIYRDIAERTGGDIYIGVVGPVRTGKSTFIKRFMESLVLPNIGDGYSRDRARDEMPQSAAGKTVMTTEPKFVPDEAVSITIDDCEKMHRAIDVVLDEVDPIEEAYYLEISSPGIERELRTDMHIEACEGWDAEVRLYAPVDGAKSFRGKILQLGENREVRLDVGGTVREFPRETVAKIRTYFEF